MFEKKVVTECGFYNSKESPATVISAMKQALGLSYSYECGKLKVSKPSRKTIQAPLFKDGFVVGEASFSPEDAIRAIAEVLGVELQAHYVVGSGQPALKAIKKTKTRA